MGTEKPKILIVDDESEIVDILAHSLRLKGYEAKGAYNGQDALGILQKEKVDLVLLDLNMPGLSGQDMVKIIKNKYPNVKIIIVTAFVDEGQKLFQEKHLEGLFIKPMRLQELHCKLREVIESKIIQKAGFNEKKNVRERLFLIKAKLLFWEPASEFLNFLKRYFNNLSKKGEIYQIENVLDELSLTEKVKKFKPEILVVNMAVFSKIHIGPYLKDNLGIIKEIIIYKRSGNFIQDVSELERLAKTIQLVCLKNGLIEIK
ncbi:MAG: response regulator [Candidatus Omnitrophota bacterium]